MTRFVASPSKTGLARQAVTDRVGRAGGDGLLGHDVDGHPVLGVHHDQPAVRRGLLHRPEDRPVVAVEDARVGREQLEVGHALGDERVHLLERVVVDVAHDHVEAVVGDGVALGLRVPRVQPVAQRAAPRVWTAKSTIVVVPPNAAARVPVSKVSLANVPPNGSSMWVWTSIAPGMTYLPAASMVSSAVDAGPRQVRPDGRDRLAVDQDVGGLRALRGDDGAVGDERAHRSLLVTADPSVRRSGG